MRALHQSYFFLVMICFSSSFLRAEKSTRLFTIERSTNANIVCYDAIVDDEGSAFSGSQVDAYWLMNAEDGHQEGLNLIEKKVYGVLVEPNTKTSVTLKIRAMDSKEIIVSIEDQKPVAMVEFEGRKAVLEKIYVEMKDSFFPKVAYIKLSGHLTDGTKVSEKIVL